jgi:superoxide dismutase, Cu-Zn family
MNLTAKITIAAITIIVCMFSILFLFGKDNYVYIKAVAKIKGGKVTGIINFEETSDDSIHCHGIIKNLAPGKHGLFIHEYGDTCGACKKLGGHYNPTNKEHGPRCNYSYKRAMDVTNERRHVGDLGNITADAKGIANVDFHDKLIKLRGIHSILGRGVAVTMKPDDAGGEPSQESRDTGSSGDIVACGTIIHSINE